MLVSVHFNQKCLTISFLVLSVFNQSRWISLIYFSYYRGKGDKTRVWLIVERFDLILAIYDQDIFIFKYINKMRRNLSLPNIKVFSFQRNNLNINLYEIYACIIILIIIITLKLNLKRTTSMICINVSPKLSCKGSDSLATGLSRILYESSKWCNNFFS